MTKTASLSLVLLCAALGACDETTEQPGNSPDAPTGSSSPDARPGSGNPDAPPGSGNPDARTTGATGWHTLDFPGDTLDVRVTGFHCTTPDVCVLTTGDFAESGKIYDLSTAGVGAVVLDAETVLDTAEVGGHIAILGLDLDHDRLIARIDNSRALVSATGDFTKASSWTQVKMGTHEGVKFALNEQEAVRSDGAGHFVMVTHVGGVYSSAAAPAAETQWTSLWSPQASPSVPADFEERHNADPTLCDSDVSTTQQPVATQNVYIGADLGIVVFPAKGLNQHGSAPPGVCISTDKGVTFFSVPLPGLADLEISSPGPIAATCLDNDHCFAYNGLPFQDGSQYVFYTDNATAVKDSVWHRATIPAALEASDSFRPHHMFFAPDKLHGWLAGANNETPMLLATVDGGHTWTDKSGAIIALTDQRLHSGFAIDNDHVYLGGENGTVIYTSTASQ